MFLSRWIALGIEFEEGLGGSVGVLGWAIKLTQKYAFDELQREFEICSRTFILKDIILADTSVFILVFLL